MSKHTWCELVYNFLFIKYDLKRTYYRNFPRDQLFRNQKKQNLPSICLENSKVVFKFDLFSLMSFWIFCPFLPFYLRNPSKLRCIWLFRAVIESDWYKDICCKKVTKPTKYFFLKSGNQYLPAIKYMSFQTLHWPNISANDPDLGSG